MSKNAYSTATEGAMPPEAGKETIHDLVWVATRSLKAVANVFGEIDTQEMNTLTGEDVAMMLEPIIEKFEAALKL